MIANLHGLLIELDSQDERVRRQWRTLFDYELAAQPQAALTGEPDFVLQITVLPAAPSAPVEKPFYESKLPPLKVYAQANQVILIPSNQIQISLRIGAAENKNGRQKPDAEVLMTPIVLENGSFEDMISLTLAPFLRRKGFFMIHAFVAAFEQQAVIFSGPSGSGKTTAGLALLHARWRLLANDVALLRENFAVEAALAPGTIHATPSTFALLPDLARFIEHRQPHPYRHKIAIPRLELLDQANPDLPAAVKIVCFPEIDRNSRHHITDLPRAVGLARLMEDSMDQWDRGTWDAHVDFLERLSRQAGFRKLTLGSNLSTLPDLLENELRQL